MFSLTAVVLQFLFCHTLSQSREQNVLFQDDHLNHLQFSEGEVFMEMSVQSSLLCARLCSASPSCKAFTYTPGGSCRIHDTVMTSESPSTSVRGAMTYRLKTRATWLQNSCASDKDCPVVSSTCFQGHCLCAAGYFYSLTSQTCVDTCPRADLQDTYVTYPNSIMLRAAVRVTEFAGNSTRTATLEECQAVCNAIEGGERCVAVFYDYLRACYQWGPVHFTASDVQAEFVPGAVNNSFSQRMCV